MRKRPMNYLITLAIAAVSWFGTAILLGNYLGDSVALENATTDTFIQVYRAILIAVAVLGLVNCCYWYFYGAKETTGGNVPAARRVWRLSMAAQVAIAATAVIALVLAFSDEQFTSVEYLLVFGAASAHTYIFFWICTLFMSPRPVEYVPLGRG
ncbi:MAG TPA: hypothetical protein VEK57_00280 [Thermoanaerobaculia bacterium]|nr:hypothetical protein [Thermoanaerobaculia bacterium]